MTDGKARDDRVDGESRHGRGACSLAARTLTSHETDAQDVRFGMVSRATMAAVLAQPGTPVSVTRLHVAPSAFFVELGAPMIVASTIVPVPTFKPWACSTWPPLANKASPSL